MTIPFLFFYCKIYIKIISTFLNLGWALYVTKSDSNCFDYFGLLFLKGEFDLSGLGGVDLLSFDLLIDLLIEEGLLFSKSGIYKSFDT